VAGFFDVATAGGLSDYDEDLGQTLAVWGWEDSRYFVLPFLGLWLRGRARRRNR